METKNKRVKLDHIRRSLNFLNSCYVDPIGTSGGLALWWMDGAILDVRSKSQNILRCIISSPAVKDDYGNGAQRNSLAHELELVLQREEMYLHQRSRVHWLNFGDRNSAFFHATIKQRHQRNQILQLKCEDGTLLSSESDINSHLFTYFSNLFSGGGSGEMDIALDVVHSVISLEMNALLIQEVVDEEIKTAIFQLGLLKAPRPDGFPGFFYHQHWDIVGPSLCAAVKSLRIKQGCPKLSHLFFANDALLFVKANRTECSKICKLLQIYGQATGQSVNFDKSGVQFSGNVSWSHRREVCGFLGIPQMQANARYLGLPSCWGRSKAEAYNFLCEKMLSKLQGWKAKLLSQASREVLIKSVAQALPTYAMACFLFPNKLCDKFSSYIRNFWWKGDPERRDIHWASWNKLCLSKRNGGLSFRDFRAFNCALFARQGWRLIEYPNSLCAKIIKGIYYPNSDFCHATRGVRLSWAWLSLLQGWNILNGGLRWQILNGKSVNFWDDQWIPSNPGFRVQSERPRGVVVQKVHEVMVSSRKLWNESQLRSLVSGVDCDAILFIPVYVTDKDDTLLWHYDSKGYYTVKLGYREAVKQAHLVSTIPSSSIVWSENEWLLKGRNDHLFNQCQVDPTGVIAKAKRDEAEFLATCPAATTPQIGASGTTSGGSSWVPPSRSN
ncbi:uncharacterized protein LOC114284266 [Camellia sinensis]|uniref:uncharacterized protein LOC114284266 n=1 Tax=Camellia sinensis TaxID=4442 RepID=UPI001035D500|nr:uncharacterized protein LOC114284266 [Camellia sinensis]